MYIKRAPVYILLVLCILCSACIVSTDTISGPTTVAPTSTPHPETTSEPSTTSPPTTTPAPTAPPGTRPPVECTPSWPQLQNTDNRAYSTCEIPLDLQLLWSTQVDTITRNALIVANGRAYVPGDTSLHCLDAETGTLLWSYHAANILNGTPAYCDGRVFLGDKAGILHCIDADTGERTWTRQIDENPGGFSSLLVADRKIYVIRGHVAPSAASTRRLE
jgi:outer membrane protein assembly factor BamB